MTPGALALAVLDTAASVLVDPPERAYVAHGSPAGDLCEELVVWVDSYQAIPTPRPRPSISTDSARSGGCVVLHQVRVNVQLTRCHPTVDDLGYPPAPDDLTDVAVRLTDEAWSLWCGLISSTAEWGGDWVTWDTAQVSDPEGGYASWTISFTSRID